MFVCKWAKMYSQCELSAIRYVLSNFYSILGKTWLLRLSNRQKWLDNIEIYCSVWDHEGSDTGKKSKGRDRGGLRDKGDRQDRDLKALGAWKWECCHSQLPYPQPPPLLPSLPPLPNHPTPPESNCDACSSHSCRRSNTQVRCTATLKAHQAHTLLVGNTLFMTEPAEA